MLHRKNKNQGGNRVTQVYLLNTWFVCVCVCVCVCMCDSHVAALLDSRQFVATAAVTQADLHAVASPLAE